MLKPSETTHSQMQANPADRPPFPSDLHGRSDETRFRLAGVRARNKHKLQENSSRGYCIYDTESTRAKKAEVCSQVKSIWLAIVVGKGYVGLLGDPDF